MLNRIAGLTLVSLMMCASARGEQAQLLFQGYAGTTALTNFQALVKLPEAVPGFRASADGRDIWFEDETGRVVPHEIDTWDSSGQSFVWVKVPRLNGPRTSLTLHWGDVQSRKTADAADRVWEGFTGVWHMGQASGAEVEPDRSGFGNDAVPRFGRQGSAKTLRQMKATADGVVGGARVNQSSLERFGNALVAPNGYWKNLSTYGEVSFSGWFKSTRVARGRYQVFFSSRRDDNTTCGIEFYLHDNRWDFGGVGGDHAKWKHFVSPSFAEWTYVTAVFDGTANVKLYVNGTETELADSCEAISNGGAGLGIGNAPTLTTHSWCGLYDEVRVADGAQGADRVQADYETMRDPAGFLHAANYKPVPKTSSSMAELLADWRLQAGGAQPTNLTETAWREQCLARRAARLEPLRAFATKWVYCRHYVPGKTVFQKLVDLSDGTSPLSDDHDYRAVGSSVCLAEYVPDGLWQETTLLRTSAGCFRDVDVSPDGTRILYSYRADRDHDDFHLYEMTLATRQVRQLTFGKGASDIEGCYLADGCILFASTRCSQVIDCWFSEVDNLYRCEADGSNITRITFDQVHDYYPTLTWDGRVFYTRWEYNDRGQIYTQPLMAMNPDGTTQRAIYGANSFFPNTIIHARAVPNSPYFFAIGTGHHAWQPGELMRFDPRAGREETEGCWQVAPLRKATFVRKDSDFGQQGALSAYPYPVNDESVVLAQNPRGRKAGRERDHAMGLYWMDVQGARELLVAQKGKVSCGRPVPVRARKLVARTSKRPHEDRTTGTVTIRNVYAGEAMKGAPAGCVKSLRVVSLDYRPIGTGWNLNQGPLQMGASSSPPAIGNGTWMVKRVLGEVPVAADGSVAVTVPARTPLYFQLLDEKGRLVQTMRSWTTLQPDEVASCVGCHERTNESPDYHTASMPRATVALAPASRAFSFREDVQPILARRCLRCHNRDDNPKLMDLSGELVKDITGKRYWSRAYVNLTHSTWLGKKRNYWADRIWIGNPDHPVLNWVASSSTPKLIPPCSRGSRTSKLFSEMLDKGHAPGLTDVECRTLALWVDLGVPFCGAYDELVEWDANDRARWNRAILRRERFRTPYEP